MEIIVDRLIPLYALALLGFLAGKLLAVKKETIAPILIYILSPSVVFFAVLDATLDARIFYLPVLSFSIGTLICVISYLASKPFFKDSTRNLIGFASGDANAGYFGIPIALALFGTSLLPPYIMLVFGLMIYENTVGYYVTARGNFDHKESLKRIIKLPTLYAFFTGLILNYYNIKAIDAWADIGGSLRGAYTTLGMMIIGLGIASLKKFTIDWSLVSFLFLSKFILWLVVTIAIIVIDQNSFQIINPNLFPILIFFSSLPLAANTVTFAAELRVEPEKAAVVVLVSTVIATLYIPFIHQNYDKIALLFGF